MAEPTSIVEKVQETLPALESMMLESNFEFWKSCPSSCVDEDKPVVDALKAFDGEFFLIFARAGESITALEPANIEESLSSGLHHGR